LFTAIDFGNNIGTAAATLTTNVDLNLADALVNISQQNRELFY